MNFTSLDDAFDYDTALQMNQFKPLTFSKICVFCGSAYSKPLMSDGSYCFCFTCKKNFKAEVASVETVCNKTPYMQNSPIQKLNQGQKEMMIDGNRGGWSVNSTKNLGSGSGSGPGLESTDQHKTLRSSRFSFYGNE